MFNSLFAEGIVLALKFESQAALPIYYEWQRAGLDFSFPDCLLQSRTLPPAESDLDDLAAISAMLLSPFS
jgi:hypothetical protein